MSILRLAKAPTAAVPLSATVMEAVKKMRDAEPDSNNRKLGNKTDTRDFGLDRNSPGT
jgi:hypothetical protein